MQQLQWEQAWDRTISDEDRAEIENRFEQTKQSNEAATFIREAINHRSDLLVTAIIHNRTNSTLTIQNDPITYTNHQNEQWHAPFTVPMPIPAYTSMPWTFIFTNEAKRAQAQPQTEIPDATLHITWEK